MPQNRPPARGNLRLLWIDLPWMEVDHRGLAFRFVDTADCPLRDGIGCEPQITPAGNAPVVIPFSERGRWKLEHCLSAGSLDPVRKPFSVGNTVQIMPDGKH